MACTVLLTSEFPVVWVVAAVMRVFDAVVLSSMALPVLW